MTTRYGYDLDVWNTAKDQMRRMLIERAKVRGMIPYSELVQQVHAIRFGAEAAAFHAMLGEIAQEEDQQGRGMLSVIVVHKCGDMQPGPGFFALARQMGRDTTDILPCWIQELNKVHAYWSLQK